MAWDHRAKVELAGEIARRVAARFGDAVLFGCVTGSVARGDDTPLSDLDTLFLAREPIRLPDMSPDGYREFLCRGLKVQIEFRTVEEAREILANTGPYWPFQVKDFLEPTVVYGQEETVAATLGGFHSLLQELPDAGFRRGAGHALMWAQAALAKIEAACQTGDAPRAVQGAHGMGHNTAAFVALVNRRYYRFVDIRLREELESFPLVPVDYGADLVRLYLARGQEELLPAARRLWEACVALADEQDVRMERIENLEGVGL